jgi:hypothetical protein
MQCVDFELSQAGAHAWRLTARIRFGGLFFRYGGGGNASDDPWLLIP